MRDKQPGLTSRQHRLKDFLKDNFEPGKYFSIKEICSNVRFSDGELCYEYDDRITTHDHCVALGNDVRAINECLVDGWKLIIKDKQGGVKLAESKEEFMEWWNAEKAKVDNRAIKLNMMLSKAEQDGFMPLVNQAGNTVDPNKDLTPIDAYAGVKTYTRVLVDVEKKLAYIVTAQKIKINYETIKHNSANILLANGEKITLENISDNTFSIDTFNASRYFADYERKIIK